MKRYIEKPHIIEAYQTPIAIDVKSLSGITLHAEAGDFLVYCPDGDVCIYKPDVFNKMYEELV